MVMYCNNNKSAQQGNLSHGLQKIVLANVFLTRNLKLSETNTWYQGRTHIETVWVWNDVDVASSGLLPFGFGVGGNQGFLIDIPLPSMIG